MPFDRCCPTETGVGPQPGVVDERRREATFEVPDEGRRPVGVAQFLECPPEAFQQRDRTRLTHGAEVTANAQAPRRAPQDGRPEDPPRSETRTRGAPCTATARRSAAAICGAGGSARYSVMPTGSRDHASSIPSTCQDRRPSHRATVVRSINQASFGPRTRMGRVRAPRAAWRRAPCGTAGPFPGRGARRPAPASPRCGGSPEAPLVHLVDEIAHHVEVPAHGRRRAPQRADRTARGGARRFLEPAAHGGGRDEEPRRGVVDGPGMGTHEDQDAEPFDRRIVAHFSSGVLA